ncbi:MAG: AI-2E family transporter [Oligoflexia bacterium]|nr:AI-2E family transporter [Oligoflexia bacterium]
MAKSGTQDSLLPPRWILGLFCLALVAWLLVSLKEIVVMLVLGYCIAYVMDPLLTWLERRKISRSYGCVLSMIAAVVVLLLLIFTAVPTVVREFDKLADNLPTYIELAKERGVPLLERIEHYLPHKTGQAAAQGATESWMPQVDKDTLRRVLAAVGSTLLQGYSLTLTLLNFLLLPFIAFYLAVDLPLFHSWVLKIFPSPSRRKVVNIATEIDSYVSAFVRGQLTVGCILFILYAFGLWLIGVELWFLLAIISGFGAIIPYMGFLMGIVLSSIMALATFGDFTHLAQVIGLYLVVQFLEGWVITPKVVGEKVGLSPLVIIISIFAGGHLFGLLGVFLAVPGAAVLRVLLKHAHGWLLEPA